MAHAEFIGSNELQDKGTRWKGVSTVDFVLSLRIMKLVVVKSLS